MKITCANVGFTNTEADRDRITQATLWVVQNLTAEWHADPWAFDDIDLNYGRDFLAERARYRAVLLQHLYCPDYRPRKPEQGIFRISPLQDVGRWKARLLDTQADLIFAFGTNTEVSGEWLGRIAGYTMLVPSWGFTVYIFDGLKIS